MDDWDYELGNNCSGWMWCRVSGCHWNRDIVCSDLSPDGVAEQAYREHWDIFHGA